MSMVKTFLSLTLFLAFITILPACSKTSAAAAAYPSVTLSCGGSACVK